MRESAIAASGGVVAAFLASLCCIGPIVLVTVGVGAGLAATFEPLRPALGVVMVLLLGFAFYSVYRKGDVSTTAAKIAGQACSRTSRRREKAFLWVGVGIAIVLWTFPTWSTWLL